VRPTLAPALVLVLATAGLLVAPPATARAGTPQPLDQALVAWWRADGDFSEATGQFPGTGSGAVSFVWSPHGQALSFDGTNGVVSVPDAPGLDRTGSLTIAARVLFSQCLHPFGWCAVLTKSTSGAVGAFAYGLLVNANGQMAFANGNGAQIFLDYRGPDLRGSGWRQIVVTHDGSKVRYYLDGSLIYTSTSAVPLAVNGAAVEIGAESGETGGARFKGHIDEVMLFDRALSSDEVRSLHEITELFEGVTRAGTPYQVSSLVATDPAWTALLAGDGDASLSSTVLAARPYGSGRLAAWQANGLSLALDELDNRALFVNLTHWLRGASASNEIAILTGHGEVLDAALAQAWQSAGFSVRHVQAPLDPTDFAASAVLVVAGNLASTALYGENELQAIFAFVQAGGGLLQMDLGWAAPTWGAGHQLAERTGILFASDAVADPTDNFGSPLQPQMVGQYPGPTMPGLDLAQSILPGIHQRYPTNWHEAMRVAGERRAYLGALRALDLLATGLSAAAPAREAIHQFFVGLLDSSVAHDALVKHRRYDPSTYSMAAFTRDYLFKVWLLAAPVQRHGQLATHGELPPIQSQLLQSVPLLVLDNGGLDADQSTFVRDLYASIPAASHRNRVLTFLDLLRNPAEPWPGLPPELSFWDFYAMPVGVTAINGFASPIGEVASNPFSDDVEPYQSDLFTTALIHELVHAVDAHSAYGVPAMAARRQALLQRAGCDHRNYLRSVVPDCTFLDQAPGELIASTANIFGVYTARTLEVALLRAQEGRLEPMNQFLFMLDLFSTGTNQSYFWKVSSEQAPAVIQRWTVPIERDARGLIQAFQWDGWRYTFALDAGGWVSSYTRTPVATGCVASSTALCLLGGRFEVTATWRTAQGQSGIGQAQAMTSDTGYFWFFAPTNVEMVVKVLNGCGTNQHFWAFAGGLTNVGVEWHVRDTQTGAERTYTNPRGTAFQPVQDTRALGGCS
jgi:hypothetical protein